MFDLPFRDPVLVFAVLLSISLLAPLLFERIRLPGIVGLIAFGVVLGPHALGVLERGREVQLLGTVGLLYIMFMAGLELDLSQFIRDRHHSGVFGLLTFAVPLVLGTLMARYFLDGFDWPAAILLASMFSSHTLLTYPIASRLGLTKSRAVTTTIGGTIITDTLALLILAVIAASYHGDTGPLFWLRLIFFIIIYVAAVVIIVPRLGKWFFRSVATDGVVAFIGVMAVVFLVSHFAHVAGLEPIIGAFLAGLVLNSLIPEKSALMNRIGFVGNSLFIPFFLISVGMLVNVRMLAASPETWKIAGAMAVTALVTKWMAARATERWFKYTPDEGMLIYGLSVSQAAATLAAVLVGYELGIFEEPVLTGTIVMILATCLAGSWLTDRYARKVALAEDEKAYRPSTAPHRILIPLSNPRHVEELVDLALLMRRRDSKEPLYPLTVARSGLNVEERVASGEKLLGYAVVRALSASVPVSPVTRAATDIVSGVRQALVDLRISTVIAGWNARVSSRQRIFGRVLDPLIAGSRQMVIVSRCSVPVNTMERIVLALPPLVERQPGLETALRAVKNLAGQVGATILAAGRPETLAAAKEILDRAPPSLSVAFRELESWRESLPWLKSAATVNDLAVLVSVRKGRLAWQPFLDRLPRLISQDLPEINFLTVYPPEMWWGEEVTAEAREKAPFAAHFLPAERVRAGLEGVELEAAAERLLRPVFPGREDTARRLAAVLATIGLSEPVELAPGAALLHFHVLEVKSPLAFLGVNREGWELPHTSERVRALFLLLSPEGGPPEEHLRVLSELVRLLRRPRMVERLAAAATREEILDLLPPESH